MKNSSFIAESVFEMNLYYTRKQNKSKELFFKCLNENKSEEYFKQELEKIWGTDNREYIEKQITIFREQIHKQNTGLKLGAITLVGLGIIKLINDTNKQYLNKKIKEYTIRTNSPLLKEDKQDYLKKLVPKYTNDTVPYFSNGKKIRDVKPSTYNSMSYNTTLTRNGWIQTLNDGRDLDQMLFYIPYHNFSCPYCMSYQERILTYNQARRYLNDTEEGATEILHPNCKCVLAFYNNNILKTIDYGKGEEEYHIRQKVNSLTLQKSEINTDIKIQKYLGNQDSVDKLNSQRNALNKQIRDLKNQLDTDEKKKQVVAINRLK